MNQGCECEGGCLGAAGVHASAIHPGGIMTELSWHLQQEDFQFLASRMSGITAPPGP